MANANPIISRQTVNGTQPSNKFGRTLVQALHRDLAEETVSFGRWWFEPVSAQLVISTVAADLLDADAGLHFNLANCFTQVVPDDLLKVISALTSPHLNNRPIDLSFRVIDQVDGLRWLRMVSLPSETMDGIRNGMIIDITATKHALVRERIICDTTKLLVGTPHLEDAMTEVIQLICENLGWEWGAYWAIENKEANVPLLACKHYWHNPAYSLTSFTRESCALRVAPGEGLVGQTWRTGEAGWIEDMAYDPLCVRRKSIRECGLQSGYAFPVTYVTNEDDPHSPGILEFFSRLPRQRGAQLPHISTAIGALTAQTIQKLEHFETIRRLAQIDDLTGLANRSHFHQLMHQACVDAATHDAIFGLLYIDLDRFKPVNDGFGHQVGNEVLFEFSRRLTELLPNRWKVGRIGGDEFAVLSPPTTSRAQLRSMAEQILQAAASPFFYQNNELALSASIGISVFPKDGITTSDLISCADAAMYRSKNNGRNSQTFYADGMSSTHKITANQLTIEGALHHALENNELFLEYQPIYDSFAEHLVSVEALIRWRRQDGEIIRPDIFIPIAEQSHLIVQIGRWVLKQACQDLSAFHRAGFSDLQVNVNMATPEFTRDHLVEDLVSLVVTAGLEPRHICLELTEGMVMTQAEKVIPVMQELRDLGFDISLDDFGMGHSSLSRLKELPISSLKIDRSFVRGLPDSGSDRAIVRTIFDLGSRMQLRIVAEGIETEEQLVFLRQMGHPLMQGFLLGRPTSPANLIAMRDKTRSDTIEPDCAELIRGYTYSPI